MKPRRDVIACGDGGFISSVFTSGGYDHGLLKQHIWEDNLNEDQAIFTYSVVSIFRAI